MTAPVKLVCLDCDSTLSGIEGIDELARMRGPEVLARVERMTREAMEGTIPLESVYSLRLDIIQPTRADVEEVGRRYIDAVEPDAREALAALGAAGWTPVIVSGGYVEAIRPLAAFLGIGRVEAVSLRFDSAGRYAGYDAGHPASRSGGKPEILRRLRRELGASRVAMVGDGLSDLETAPEVDLFVGFGRYAVRERVKREAGAYLTSLAGLPEVLGT
jgi:phosphoserine phosphatase